MNWKLFITAFISCICVLFPYNIIGCGGGDIDPYDYYVSFFQKKLAGDAAYEPFYYTNNQFLYDATEPVNVAELTAAEWTGFAGNSFSGKEAYDFVCRFSLNDLSSLYYHLEKNQPLKLPDSVKDNGMTKFFLQQKNLEALGYILYAKQAEPHVINNWNGWESTERDGDAMNRLIKNGLQLRKVAKNDFIKLRYAYQVVRLAHYNKRYTDCIKWYNELVKPNTTKSVLQELSIGLKAGAEFRTGMRYQAAYTFSQLFSKSNLKKVANYMSFDWCVNRFDEGSRKKCLQLCRNNTEKANMLCLFALGSNKNELSTLRQVFTLTPQSSTLPVLVTREINKLEEFCFSPSLQFSQGKQKAYIGFTEVTATENRYKAWQQECIQLTEFCNQASAADKQKALYMLAGAHAAMIAGNKNDSRILLDQVKKENLTPLQQDQWFLTNLLLTINSQKTIDANFENELIPSIQWLEKKALADNEFAKFYRRLFADILSTKYKSTKDKNTIKYILCTSVADKINKEYVKESWGYYAQSLDILRKEVPAKQVEELIQLFESKKLNSFEKLLVSNCTFSKEDAIDVAGTAWLRQYNFTEAEKWFKKVPANYYKQKPFKTYLAANPFADLLLDTHAPTDQDTVTYTKLLFVQRMIQLEKQAATATEKESKAMLLYELAKGYYHMSYWGNSWLLVAYYWSGAEYDFSDNSQRFYTRLNPDYYEIKKAKEYYLAALAATADKNFQAKCIYMAAKCDQKKAGNIPWDKAGVKQWVQDFDKRNSYYSKLQKEFGTTPFYKEAFTTCSYLQDFVKQSD